VDNAGKWARARVDISAVRDPRPDAAGRPYFLTRIDDDGPGLDPQARSAALRRGRKLDESRPGSGLGLSIIVDLAQIYGGSLSLEDSPLGGLRATLRLPTL
jgi:signal transduction histidine kinase